MIFISFAQKVYIIFMFMEIRPHFPPIHAGFPLLFPTNDKEMLTDSRKEHRISWIFTKSSHNWKVNGNYDGSRINL